MDPVPPLPLPPPAAALAATHHKDFDEDGIAGAGGRAGEIPPATPAGRASTTATSPSSSASLSASYLRESSLSSSSSSSSCRTPFGSPEVSPVSRNSESLLSPRATSAPAATPPSPLSPPPSAISSTSVSLSAAWQVERARRLRLAIHRSRCATHSGCHTVMGAKLSRRRSHAESQLQQQQQHHHSDGNGKHSRRNSDAAPHASAMQVDSGSGVQSASSSPRVSLPSPAAVTAPSTPLQQPQQFSHSPLHSARPSPGSVAVHGIPSPARRASSQPAASMPTPMSPMFTGASGVGTNGHLPAAHHHIASPGVASPNGSASRPPHHPGHQHHSQHTGAEAVPALAMTSTGLAGVPGVNNGSPSPHTPASAPASSAPGLAQRQTNSTPSSPIASASPLIKSHYALLRHNNYAVPADLARTPTQSHAHAHPSHQHHAIHAGAHSPSKSPSDIGRVMPLDPSMALPPLTLPASAAAAANAESSASQSEEKEAQLFSPAYVLPPDSSSDPLHPHAHNHHHQPTSVNSIQTTVAAQSAVVATAVATAGQAQGATASTVAAAGTATAPATEEEFDPFLFIKNLPPLSEAVRTCSVPVLPARSPSAPRIALALDLDETLVHCSVEPLPKYDLSFSVHFGGAEYRVYVRLRPHLYTFLRTVREWFEVIIFTASQRVYAEKLLDILEREERFTHHRLFRDACVCVQGNYLKDLTVLGRPLSSTCIVDNSVQAFGYQLGNGIPCSSFFDDEDDQELLKLLPFLNHLRECADVRPTLKQTFRLEEFVQSL